MNSKSKKTKRRVKISVNDHKELLEARRWCQEKGMAGFAAWYDEYLGFLEWRGSLPGNERRGPQQDGDDER